MDLKTLSRYMVHGITKDFPTEKEDTKTIYFNFKSAKEEFLQILTDNINSLHREDSVYTLSGGLDTTAILSLLNKEIKHPIIHVDVIGNKDTYFSKMFASDKKLNLKIYNDTKYNLEEILLDLVKVWDEPHYVAGDINCYIAYKHIKEFSNHTVAGSGSETLLMGFNWIYRSLIELAIRKRHYNVGLASQYMADSYWADIDSDENIDIVKSYISPLKSDTYRDRFMACRHFCYFSDKELEDFGLSFPEEYNPISESASLQDSLWASHNWYKIVDRTTKIGDYMGVKTVSPFKEESITKFCMSLPVEMKYCLGSTRHIMRNALSGIVPGYVLNRSKEAFMPYPSWYAWMKKEIRKISDKYLSDPKAKIYEYLDFSLVQKHIKEMEFHGRKELKFIMLNLWLEERGNNAVYQIEEK